jgi:hypothetical protein
MVTSKVWGAPAWQPLVLTSFLLLSTHADQPPRGVPPSPLAVDGNRLVSQDTGEEVTLRGLNWFGFNVNRTAVDGLSQSDADTTADFATIVYQLRLVWAGTNAVSGTGSVLRNRTGLGLA